MMTNKLVASMIGVKDASRVLTVKPSGTSSLVVGSSSGIHAWHDEYYVRRMRFNKNEAILQYLLKAIPSLVEADQRDSTSMVVGIPQQAPVGSAVRSESALELLERVSRYNKHWVGKGHRRGDNHNNVSVTVSIRENEWEEVGDWMWNNREDYNGISVLPYSGHTYVQAPFETISKEEYDVMFNHLSNIDLTKVKEKGDQTSLATEAACAGDGCEVSDFV